MPEDELTLVRKRREEITFRTPASDDGADINRLIGACKPLDENSLYCNLLQCDHFSDTCIVAEHGGRKVGWISAYLLPDDPQTLFVWQVAVDSSAQGMGVGKRMLRSLLDRDVCSDVEKLKTTITDDNEASWALFGSLARSLGGRMTREPHYRRDAHFDGEHATEHMVTIAFDEQARQAA